MVPHSEKKWSQNGASEEPFWKTAPSQKRTRSHLATASYPPRTLVRSICKDSGHWKSILKTKSFFSPNNALFLNLLLDYKLSPEIFVCGQLACEELSTNPLHQEISWSFGAVLCKRTKDFCHCHTKTSQEAKPSLHFQNEKEDRSELNTLMLDIPNAMS